MKLISLETELPSWLMGNFDVVAVLCFSRAGKSQYFLSSVFGKTNSSVNQTQMSLLILQLTADDDIFCGKRVFVGNNIPVYGYSRPDDHTTQ